MFKHIFGITKNIRFTKYLLENVCGFKPSELKGMKILNSIKLTTEKYKNKKFETDVIVRLKNEDVINLEMYNKPKEASFVKSQMYVCRIHINEFLSGEDYSNANVVKQYNFLRKASKRLGGDRYGIQNDGCYTFTEEKYIQIKRIRIDKEKEWDKGMNDKGKRLLRFMNASSKEEIEKIAKEDEMLMEMLQEMDEYVDENYLTPCYDRDKYLKSLGREEGMEKGMKKGKKETIISVVKNMLKSNISPEDIAKYTNLTIEEVNRYKKKLNK